MLLSDLYDEIADSIRTHHASGHFSHDEAMERLVKGQGMTSTRAAEVLAAPVPFLMFDKFKTYPADGACCAPCGECSRPGEQMPEVA